MSIGVVVESVAKSRCGFMKEAGVSIRHSQKEASDAQYLTVKHNVQSGVKASCIVERIFPPLFCEALCLAILLVSVTNETDINPKWNDCLVSGNAK